MIKNNYYSIAERELYFIEKIALSSSYYNEIIINCHQAAENFLKYIVATYCINANEQAKAYGLQTHSIRKLLHFIQEQIPTFTIDNHLATLLQGYANDLSEPGLNFFTATQEDMTLCYEALKEIEKAVKQYMTLYEDALLKA